MVQSRWNGIRTEHCIGTCPLQGVYQTVGKVQGDDQSSVLTGLAEESIFSVLKKGAETSWSKVLPVQVEFVDPP